MTKSYACFRKFKLICQFFIMCTVLEIIKQKGLEHITVDDLVREITPKGRGN